MASSTPSTSFFKTLRDGALLPTRNPSLFMAVFALTVAYTLLRRLVNDLAVSTDELLGDYMARAEAAASATLPRASLSSLIFSSEAMVTAGVVFFASWKTTEEVHKVLRDVAKDTWRLFWPGGAQRLLDITVGNAVWIISLFAAVATYTGETAQVKGAALTIAFTWGLQVAYIVLLLSAMAAILIVNRLFEKVPTGPLLLGWLLLIAAAVFLKYFAFICELGIVVAVAEPGRHSASAIGQAWRLLRRRRMRAVLLTGLKNSRIPVRYPRDPVEPPRTDTPSLPPPRAAEHPLGRKNAPSRATAARDRIPRRYERLPLGLSGIPRFTEKNRLHGGFEFKIRIQPVSTGSRSNRSGIPLPPAGGTNYRTGFGNPGCLLIAVTSALAFLRGFADAAEVPVRRCDGRRGVVRRLRHHAFYYECRERNVEATTTEYLKLASEELIGA
ncbi:hypothetical protein HU200_009785 [Digitaria exilis]|uniref:Uncharacterized protein n=1 Tax=Digitaria exilis TaxID=1010633 RepID=A0A835FKK7_9POAL|nr:hypothetical protein HU200_009785 [Digitaria exilis]